MKITRREFVAGSLTTLGATALLPHANALAKSEVSILADKPYRGALPIAQGMTNHFSAQFTILIDAKKIYGYQAISSTGQVLPLHVYRREARTFNAWGVEKLMVTDLQIGQNYTLNVIDPSGKVIDQRTFRALDLNASKARFAIASCMNDFYSGLREEMWDQLALTNPDFVLLLGDTCYSDNDNDDGDEKGYWSRYVETRTTISHFRHKKLVPTLAIWDDHDFGGNNYDTTFREKPMMKEMFEIFWDNTPTEGLTDGPGVAKAFTAAGQRFFLMDGRYYRTPTNVNRPQQWGDEQETWLFDQLGRNDSPAWLMNGSQFFGGYLKKDAFEYWHGQNLKDICAELKKFEAPVVFAGGDVHFSEIMELEPELLGYKTYEFTSSSIHSHSIPGLHLRKKNKRRLDASSAKQFMLFEATNTSAGWKIEAKSLGKKLKQYLHETVTIRR